MVVRKMISITEEQDEFLNKHPQYSLSGITQQAIDKLRKGGK